MIGTGSSSNRDFVLGLGADEYIDYTQQDVGEAINDADVALDTVGGDVTASLLPALRDGGAIVLVAGCVEGIGSDDYVAGLHEAGSPKELLSLIYADERTPRHDQWQIQ